MSEILVNTIKKADGTGSLTVPAETGTVLTSGGAIDVDASAPADSLAIESSGKVGIGTSSPNGVLTLDRSTNTNADTMYILRGSGNSLPASIDTQTALLVQNRSDTFSTNISIIADDVGASSVNLGDQSDENAGRISYLHDVNAMQFNTNGNTERMRISSGGSLSINDSISTLNGITGFLHVNTNNGNVYGINIDKLRNNTSGSGGIQVKRNETAGESDVLRITSSGGSEIGSIRSSNSGTSFNTTSDYRLKENLVDLTDGIIRLKQLPVHRFNFISDPDVTVDGFLAHEAQEVVPEAVSGVKDAVNEEGAIKPQSIDQSKLVPLLTGALQEAIAKIETLETTVADLQTRVTALEGA